MRLLRRRKRAEALTLYNEKGHLVARLSPELVYRTFCVCITRDNYGPLATDLALLLEREDGEPYPWPINVLDSEILGGHGPISAGALESSGKIWNSAYSCTGKFSLMTNSTLLDTMFGMVRLLVH